jgi:hypothetical protein
MNKSLIPVLKETLQLDLPENISYEVLQEKLSAYINHLIQADFDKLVSLLYRLDINEVKLKKLLKEYPGEDAGKIIADLMIERQEQKIKSRQQYSKRDDNIAEDDKW